jgi:hypothetical protein
MSGDPHYSIGPGRDLSGATRDPCGPTVVIAARPNGTFEEVGRSSPKPGAAEPRMACLGSFPAGNSLLGLVRRHGTEARTPPSLLCTGLK